MAVAHWMWCVSVCACTCVCQRAAERARERQREKARLRMRRVVGRERGRGYMERMRKRPVAVRGQVRLPPCLGKDKTCYMGAHASTWRHGRKRLAGMHQDISRNMRHDARPAASRRSSRGVLPRVRTVATRGRMPRAFRLLSLRAKRNGKASPTRAPSFLSLRVIQTL